MPTVSVNVGDGDLEMVRRMIDYRHKMGSIPEATVSAYLRSSSGSTTESRTMTIADEHGNPMVIPYDPMLMETTKREREAKAREAEGEEMPSRMSASGGHQGQALPKCLVESLLKPLEDQGRPREESAQLPGGASSPAPRVR